MTKMSKSEIKTKWLEELRSGNHNQVEGTLCGTTEDGEVGYCCLGVLLKFVLNTDIAQEPYPEEGYGLYEGRKEHYETIRNILHNDITLEGSDMNDSGEPFEVIAKMIEEKWVTE